MNKLRKALTSQKGEAHISTIFSVIILMSVLSVALSTFQVIGVKDEADRIADALLETATFYGGFGTEFDAKVAQLQDEYFDFTVTYDATWFNQTYKRVQLGDPLSVTITFTAHLFIFGLDVPIELPVVRTGASERYWK